MIVVWRRRQKYILSKATTDVLQYVAVCCMNRQTTYRLSHTPSPFRKYHVRVTTTELQFGYKAECAQMRIDKSKIESVDVIEKISPCCDWGGYGIRVQFVNFGTENSTWEKGYMPKSGSGIRVTFKDDHGKEKAYTFICDEPEKVARMLSPST